MARGMNHVYLIGAVARDPELRYTPNNNTPVLEITVSGTDIVHRNTPQGNEEIRLPWYVRVNLMGQQATYASERGLKAGDGVMIEGALEYNAWEKDGVKQSLVRVKGLRLEQLNDAIELITDSGDSKRMLGGRNEVHLIGNAVRDAESRATTQDPITTLSIAVNERFTDRQGQVQERTNYIDCKFWRATAEYAQQIRRGDAVIVRGRLNNESWVTKEGDKRSALRVEGDKIDMLRRNGQATEQRAAPASVATPAAATKPRNARATKPVSEDLPPEEEDLPF